MANNNVQNTIKKTTDRATRIPLKTGSEHQSIWFVFLQRLIKLSSKISFTLSRFIEVPVQSQESERLCIYYPDFGEATYINFIVFGLASSWIEPTI